MMQALPRARLGPSHRNGAAPFLFFLDGDGGRCGITSRWDPSVGLSLGWGVVGGGAGSNEGKVKSHRLGVLWPAVPLKGGVVGAGLQPNNLDHAEQGIWLDVGVDLDPPIHASVSFQS